LDYNYGDVTTVSEGCVRQGGIAGEITANITFSQCYNEGPIYGYNSEGNSDSAVGGIVGYCYAVVDQCYNKGLVRNGFKITSLLGMPIQTPRSLAAYTGGMKTLYIDNVITKEVLNVQQSGNVAATYRNRVASDTLAGYQKVLISGEPIAPSHVATKNYVDTEVANGFGATGWHEFSTIQSLLNFEEGWQGFFMGVSNNSVFEWIGDVAWVWDTTTGPNTGEFFNATVNQGSFRMDNNGNWYLVGIVRDDPLNDTAMKYIRNGVIKMSGTSLNAISGGLIDTTNGIGKYSRTNSLTGFPVI
jgi:hypothetical protein